MLNALSSLYVYMLAYLHQDEGQDFIEYALIIGLIVLVAVVRCYGHGHSSIRHTLRQRRRPRLVRCTNRLDRANVPAVRRTL